MWQDFIVFLIVSGAVVYTVLSIIKNLKIKSSGSCGDTCSCSAKKDIYRIIENKKAISKKRLLEN